MYVSKYPILCPNCPILCPNYPENGPGSNQKFSATLWLSILKNQNWLSKQSSQRIFSIAQSVLELLKKKVLTWTKTCPSSKNVPHIWITTWTQNGANYPKTGPNWSTFQANSMLWNFIIFFSVIFCGSFLMGHKVCWLGRKCDVWISFYNLLVKFRALFKMKNKSNVLSIYCLN